jgi:hypothetical protein
MRTPLNIIGIFFLKIISPPSFLPTPQYISSWFPAKMITGNHYRRNLFFPPPSRFLPMITGNHYNRTGIFFLCLHYNFEMRTLLNITGGMNDLILESCSLDDERHQFATQVF